MNGIPSDLVGESRRATCNPALAEPERRTIDRKTPDVERRPRR